MRFRRVPTTSSAASEGTDEARAFYDREYQGQVYASGDMREAEVASLVEHLFPYVAAEGRVLDVGTGRAPFQAVRQRWVGVDLSPEASRFTDKPFVCASAVALPFRDGVFDAVWSVAALEHVPDPELALVEMVRVLKPGGILYLAPAWHCRSWAAQGYQVRPWSDFSLAGKLIKASIPLRNSLWLRALRTLPIRIWDETACSVRRGVRRPLRYGRLRANYEKFWQADSDACSSLDPHAVLVWLIAAGCIQIFPKGLVGRMTVRHGPVVVKRAYAADTRS